MRRRLIACAVAGFAAWVSVSAAAAGSTSTCRIADKSSHRSYGDLQSAVNAAASGDVLFIRGTCTGSTTVAASLTLKGQRGSAPTLDGAGSDTVLTVDRGVNLVIDALTITDGHSGNDVDGGGISNFGGTVTVSHSSIRGNTAAFGAGIENNQGSVTVSDSSISRNVATTDGGGIDTFPTGSVTVRGGSSIAQNTADLNGGGIANFGMGTLLLRDSTSISHNLAAQDGGGIYDGIFGSSSGSVTLRGASRIHDNTAGRDGGGINNHSGDSVSLTRASRVYHNTAGRDGGGILVNNGTLSGALAGHNVFGNLPDDIS
jgi:hypothetical protein